MTKFKVGDRIKLKDNSNGCLHGFDIGDICEIFEIDDDCVVLPYHIRNGSHVGWCNKKDIELVEENKNISTTITINCNGITVSKTDNQIEREEKDMNKVLELYAKRKREEIEKKYEKKVDKDFKELTLVSEYNQLVTEFEEKMEGLFNNELNIDNSIIIKSYNMSDYQYQVKEESIKATLYDAYDDKITEERETLENLIEEVEAQLSLSNDLEYQKDILVKYDIIDKKTGKIK